MHDELYDEFQIELEKLILKYKLERYTPEDILSDYVVKCLQNFDMYVNFRDQYLNRIPKLF